MDSGLLPLAPSGHSGFASVSESAVLPIRRARPREPKAHRESRPLCRLFRFCHSIPGSHRLRRFTRGSCPSPFGRPGCAGPCNPASCRIVEPVLGSQKLIEKAGLCAGFFVSAFRYRALTAFGGGFGPSWPSPLRGTAASPPCPNRLSCRFVIRAILDLTPSGRSGCAYASNPASCRIVEHVLGSHKLIEKAGLCAGFFVSATRHRARFAVGGGTWDAWFDAERKRRICYFAGRWGCVHWPRHARRFAPANRA